MARTEAHLLGVWLEHDSMKNRPGEKKPEQPCTNGVQCYRKTGYLYYTTTSQQLMMRVKVDPVTLDPADLPEFVTGGRERDDFLLDDDAGVAYVTTHRENTIGRVRLAHDSNHDGGLGDFDAFTDLLVEAGWRVLRPQPRHCGFVRFHAGARPDGTRRRCGRGRSGPRR